MLCDGELMSAVVVIVTICTLLVTLLERFFNLAPKEWIGSPPNIALTCYCVLHADMISNDIVDTSSKSIRNLLNKETAYSIYI